MKKHLKIFYQISFVYGVFVVLSGILLIPSFILLLQQQGVHSSDIIQYMATNSMLHNSIYLGGPIRSILFGLIITIIIAAILRKKITTNKMLDIGAVALSVTSIISLGIAFFAIKYGFANSSNLAQGVGAILSFGNSSRLFTYPIFMASVLLIVIGYIKEMLNILPKKYLQAVSLSAALLVVLLYDLFKFFRF